ncbi:hypothetical protein B0H13DRAFT_1885128 [Mycena leptocephala]|nr:hypothetical protein B0H13DRAFT_1885128 [Mycena leptocephala]
MSAEQKLLSAAELQAVAPPMENITTDGPPAMSNETIVSDEAKLTAKGLTVSTAYTSSEYSSYINMPRYVRFTSPQNAWLVVWNDWKVWWDSSYSASKERSKWEVIPAGYRGGYTWYKIKSAYSGNFLCLMSLYDVEVAACSQTAFWEEATSWAAVPIDMKAGTFYLKTLTDRTYYLSTDGIWDEYTGVTLTPGASNVITVTDAIQDTDIYDIKYDLSAAQKFKLPPYVALNVLVKNESGSVETEVVQHSIKYSETRSWNNVLGQGIGTKATFICGVPGFATGSTDISIAGVAAASIGGSSAVEKSIVIGQNVEVPAQTLSHSTVVASQTRIKVPFTFKTKVVYDASESEILEGKGIFEGVLMHDFNFVPGKTEDL